MITITAQDILDLAAMGYNPTDDIDYSRRAYDAIAYDPTGHEIVIINTGPGRNGEHLFQTDDGQRYYGTEGDEDALVVLMDSSGLADQLDSDCYDENEKLLPAEAQSLAEWLTGEYEVLLATADVQEATRVLEEAPAVRGRAVARLVKACGGDQSRAARLLGLDQSTVNKILKRFGGSAAERSGS